MRIFSIFKSISGELGLFYPGSPTIFIRFAGCPLRCSWCDTLPAIPRNSGEEMSVEEAMRRVRESSAGGQVRQVLITGGEPLWQREAFEELVLELKKYGNDYQIQVETSGVCFPSSKMLPHVDWWVVDYKLPSSGEDKKIRISEFWRFGNAKSIKFPCRDLVDFEQMLTVMDQYFSLFPFAINAPKGILLSPVSPLQPSELLKWQEEASVRRPWLQIAMLNIQLHKLLGLVEDQG